MITCSLWTKRIAKPKGTEGIFMVFVIETYAAIQVTREALILLRNLRIQFRVCSFSHHVSWDRKCIDSLDGNALF